LRTRQGCHTRTCGAHKIAGCLAQRQSDFRQTKAHHEASLELFQSLQDDADIASMLNDIGTSALFLADYERAAECFESAAR